LDDMRYAVKLITLNYNLKNYTITDITLSSEYTNYTLSQIIQHPTVKNNFYCYWKEDGIKENSYHIINRATYTAHRLNTIKEITKTTQINSFSNSILIKPHDSPDISIFSSIPGNISNISPKIYYLKKNIIFKKLSLAEGAERLKNLEKKLRIIYKHRCNDDPRYSENYEKFKENHPASKNFIVNWISELIEKEEKT
ncbi:MAG: hypothetical protein M1114_00610, partial [Candidatus Dependentiae bacterium]|nr:hypothetical protein [Candidatus Dependentiae bacterium]